MNKDKAIVRENTEEQDEGRDTAPKAQGIARDRGRTQPSGVSYFSKAKSLQLILIQCKRQHDDSNETRLPHGRLAVVTSSQIRGVFGRLVSIRCRRVGLGAFVLAVSGGKVCVTFRGGAYPASSGATIPLRLGRLDPLLDPCPGRWSAYLCRVVLRIRVVTAPICSLDPCSEILAKNVQYIIASQ